MNFRKTLLALISLVLLSLSLQAQAGKVPGVAGVYDTMPGEEFEFDGKVVEIVEYMSFYCHTCYEFEKSIPIIKAKYAGKIKWKTLPIYWSDHGSSKPGEAYLIAEEMGKGEAIKKAIFHAQMVQKKNISDINVLESVGEEVGLGFEFSKKLRAGEKAGEAQKAVAMSKKIGVNETPTLVIAGNILTNSHPMNHDLDTFRINVMAILESILKQ